MSQGRDTQGQQGSMPRVGTARDTRDRWPWMASARDTRDKSPCSEVHRDTGDNPWSRDTLGQCRLAGDTSQLSESPDGMWLCFLIHLDLPRRTLGTLWSQKRDRGIRLS